MPINIDKSDINNMVLESVKMCLFENVDLKTLIDSVPGNGKNVMDAYRDVFGPEALQALSSARSMMAAMQVTFDNATPEQQQEFLQRIKGEFKTNDGWDVELDPDVMATLQETVSRVVNRKLRKMLK